LSANDPLQIGQRDNVFGIRVEFFDDLREIVNVNERCSVQSTKGAGAETP